MLIGEKYQIEQKFLDGVPQIPYQDGIDNYRGVCAHETANNGSGESEDTVLGERNWEQQDWENAFVHYFVDYQTILNVAPIEYLSWGCCSKGNPLYANVELCRTKDPKRFIQSYDRWTWTMAKILFRKKLGVTDEGSFVSHKWVSDNLSGTHQDPIEYLASHNVTWQQVVQDVSAYYKQFEEEERIMNELIAQIQQLQQEVSDLKDYNSMSVIPAWSQDAINAALNAKIIDSPEHRSFDFYAIMTILHRKGII
jgi:N-acetylmuramoyl-L-alanine amidase CwlA